MVSQNQGGIDPAKPDREALVLEQLGKVLCEAAQLHKLSVAHAYEVTTKPGGCSEGMAVLFEMVETQTTFLEALTHAFELTHLYQRVSTVALQQLLELTKKGA